MVEIVGEKHGVGVEEMEIMDLKFSSGLNAKSRID